MKIDIRDVLSIEELEANEDGYPVVSVKLFGVEMERAVSHLWDSDKQYQVFEEYAEKAADVLKAMWKMASDQNENGENA